jgi:predicted RNase H-like HicB family nuclease
MPGRRIAGVISSSRRPKMKIQLTAVFRRASNGYIAFVEELPGANTQGSTLEEARANLEEAIALVLEANRTLAEEDLPPPEISPSRSRSPSEVVRVAAKPPTTMNRTPCHPRA